MKVILLGLDGMTWQVTRQYVDAGVMPNLKKMMDQGSWGILQSTIPSITPPGWVSLATGKHPGKHGIYEFSKIEGYETKLVTKCTTPDAEPLWGILSRYGKKVAVLNVPLTYPPDEINGIMVSGMMTPGIESDFVFPASFKSELMRVVPEYRLDAVDEECLYSGDKDLLLQNITDITEDCRKLLKHVWQKDDWSLFYMVFIGPDRLQHSHWEEIISMEPACVSYFKLLDDILGDVANLMDKDTVLMVVSDHGFAGADEGFCINNFFRDTGLLQTRRPSTFARMLQGMNINSELARKMLYRLGIRELARLLPEGVKKLLKKAVPAEGIGDISGKDINWAGTRAFSLLRYGIVSINLKGREPQGTVEPEHYGDLCEHIREQLLSVKDREGRPVVKEVHRYAELYPGNNSKHGPDLIVVVNEGFMINPKLGGGIFDKNMVGNIHVKADHAIEGIFLAYGEAIIPGRVDADIYDVTPTILHLLGVPVPDDMDGKVLTGIVDSDASICDNIVSADTRQDMKTSHEYLTDEEQEELKKRLRGLGYID
ncbi:MAG: alkaline phosphatase family protein [Nitrospirota bacterium]|nr:alkaline phosphatase family protein [Nitrospirota bacterium]